MGAHHATNHFPARDSGVHIERHGAIGPTTSHAGVALRNGFLAEKVSGNEVRRIDNGHAADVGGAEARAEHLLREHGETFSDGGIDCLAEVS